MTDGRYTAVRAALGKALRAGGWTSGIDNELARISAEVERLAPSEVDADRLSEALSAAYVKSNRIDRKRAVALLDQVVAEIKEALRPRAASSTQEFSNVTITNIGGNFSLGSTNVSQQINRIRVGDTKSLSEVLRALGVGADDAKQLIAEATTVADAESQHRAIKDPDSRIRKLTDRISAAYLSSALVVPVDIGIGLLVSALSQFWGI